MSSNTVNMKIQNSVRPVLASLETAIESSRNLLAVTTDPAIQFDIQQSIDTLEGTYVMAQMVLNATGCTINISDVYPGKTWATLTEAERNHIRNCHAWVNGKGFDDCHLPYKDPKTGAVKPNCVRNALARLDQVTGLSGAEAAKVRAKLEKILEGTKKKDEE